MNKEQLLEDVKFPLKWDSKSYKMYIFDADMNMIAEVDNKKDATKINHPFEKLIGDFKEVAATSQNQRYFIYQGDFYDQEEGERIGLVRGWGRLQYKENNEERQDNIANYILIVLNS